MDTEWHMEIRKWQINRKHFFRWKKESDGITINMRNMEMSDTAQTMERTMERQWKEQWNKTKQ